MHKLLDYRTIIDVHKHTYMRDEKINIYYIYNVAKLYIILYIYEID